MPSANILSSFWLERRSVRIGASIVTGLVLSTLLAGCSSEGAAEVDPPTPSAAPVRSAEPVETVSEFTDDAADADRPTEPAIEQNMIPLSDHASEDPDDSSVLERWSDDSAEDENDDYVDGDPVEESGGEEDEEDGYEEDEE
ncbi:hypothetical protein [Streptosporangium oxazolinicum]|uniref:hypothetical protein n=1 Tax=Streptosporangium oxazolinicum TaxID=909287 RepID=UPI0031EBE076